MNTMNRKPSQTLAEGDVFSFRGERATFIGWIGYPRANRLGVYRVAVVTIDGEETTRSLNMAGSVEIH